MQSLPPAQEIRAFGDSRGPVQRGEENVVVDFTLGSAPTRKLKIGKPVSLSTQSTYIRSNTDRGG